jgi:hypothetical protein
MPLIPRQDLVAALASVVRAGRPAPVTAPPHSPAPPFATASRRTAATATTAQDDEGAAARPVGLESVLAGRTAVRGFSPRRPEAGLLGRVASVALEHDAYQWPAARHGAAPGLMLAAYRVEGLEPGLYRWSADAGAFATPRDRAPAWLHNLRDRYSDAPAILLLHDSPLRSGAEGYGGSLVRIGALGYALWLAARTHGLDACAFGGASPEVTALLRTAHAAERHLFTLVTGYAVR